MFAKNSVFPFQAVLAHPLIGRLPGFIVYGQFIHYSVIDISWSRNKLLFANINTDLGLNEIFQRAHITKIDPLAHTGTLLAALILVQNHVIVAFGTRDWGGEPDLLVWGLLIDDIGTIWGED
jgi:hypothetical protein